MDRTHQLLVVSDIHHAGAGERKRVGYEDAIANNFVQRMVLRLYRRHVWMRDPLGHSHFLDRFLEQAGEPDFVVANGDYSCDSAFVGVADEPSFLSAQECLRKLRERFGDRLRETIGDHELGKTSLVGGHGGLRLESFHRCANELGLKPFWTREVGDYVLMGVTSTLSALDIYLGEGLSDEADEWHELRDEHIGEVSATFDRLKKGQQVILFCHDPSALPFLARIPAVRKRYGRIARTVIGHLHSPFIMGTAQRLAGIPEIGFLGVSIRRMSSALRKARLWEPFKVVLCPSLTGIQLFKDGGYLTVELPESSGGELDWKFHPIPW